MYFSCNIKMSPVSFLVCGDTQLLFSEACTVASVVLHMEQSFKVSNAICYHSQVVLFAYPFDIFHIKVVVGSYQLAVAAELEKCPKELIRFSHLLKGGISPAEFLEEYSLRRIGK